MKIIATITILLLAILTSASADTFRSGEFGTSITTPGGWVSDSETTFGYLIRDAKTQTKSKIRIHSSSRKPKDLKEAVEFAFEGIQRPREGKPVPDLLYTREVTTASGIKGLKAAQGDKQASDVPAISHYYFQHPDGPIICVCAYVFYDPMIEEAYEKIILETLKFETIETPQA